MMSGILLFHHSEGLIVENVCRTNQHWGLLMTPDAHPNPSAQELPTVNQLAVPMRF